MRCSSLIRLVGLLALSCGVLACESFPSKSSSNEKSTAFKLPPLPLPRDAVEVELVLIDRPVSDPLLGKALWRDVDQVGAMSVDQRDALREAGILVGHVGSTPPSALQALLNLTDEDQERKRREANGVPRTSAKRITLPVGSESEIWSNETIVSRRVTLSDGQEKELSNVRGLFRMKAERSQDGWAKLEFVPELHHGEMTNRPFAAATGWLYRTAQEVVPLFNQRFTANLNVGEMLILSADRDRTGTLGQSLFQFEDTSGTKQRVIVVRVAELREVAPTRVSRN